MTIIQLRQITPPKQAVHHVHHHPLAVKLDLMIDQIKKKLLLHRQKGRYRSIAQELDPEQGSRSDEDTDHCSTPRISRTSDSDRRLQVLRGTPWRLFFTHPTAVCLLVAGFQYVSA